MVDKMMRHGDLEITLDDFTEDDDYDQSLTLTKEVRGEDDLLVPRDAIELMVNFLHTMTFSNYTLIEALQEEIDYLKGEAESIVSKEERYEVCK